MRVLVTGAAGLIGAHIVRALVRAGHEVVIGGWTSTHGKFSSLMAGVYRGKHLAFVGMVGTGYGQDKVKQIMPALKAAASDDNPFGGKNAPRKARDANSARHGALG